METPQETATVKTLLQIEASVFSDNGQQLAERFVANWRKVKEASLAKARTEVDRLMLPEQVLPEQAIA